MHSIMRALLMRHSARALILGSWLFLLGLGELALLNLSLAGLGLRSGAARCSLEQAAAEIRRLSEQTELYGMER